MWQLSFYCPIESSIVGWIFHKHMTLMGLSFCGCPIRGPLKNLLSYDVITGSEITPCNKIDKPLVVYRFSGTVMKSITMLRT